MKTLILLSGACLLLAVSGCSTTPRGGTYDEYGTMQGSSTDINGNMDTTTQPTAASPRSWPWPGREGGVRP